MAKATNPFMHYVADYEKEAEAFLTKYECADAIDNPRPIPIRDNFTNDILRMFFKGVSLHHN